MKTQVEMTKPATLEAAMDLAISFENLNNVRTDSRYDDFDSPGPPITTTIDISSSIV